MTKQLAVNGAILVRLMRVPVIASVALLLAACAQDRAQPDHVSRPRVDGQPELVSQADLEAVLGLAHHRLHSLLIFVAIDRVHVISQNKLTVHFHLASARLESWLEFSRVDGQWRITKEVYWDRDAQRAGYDG